jgi:hypothetical protein
MEFGTTIIPTRDIYTTEGKEEGTELAAFPCIALG